MQALALSNADASEPPALCNVLTVDWALLLSVWNCGTSFDSDDASCATVALAGSLAAADFTAALVASTQKQELWLWFLIGVVVLLCGEVWLTRRIALNR